MTENNHQKTFVTWCKVHSIIVIAIPNGGFRNSVTGKHLKEMGVLPGAPDMLIPIATRRFHGLFIEMKVPGKGAIKTQREVGAILTAEGYQYSVCQGYQAAQKVTVKYFDGWLDRRLGS